MSLPANVKVTCPKCGEKADFTIWQSVNADISPALYDQLIDGTLFAFECPKCGEKSNAIYPLLYHDMTNKLMISYSQEGDEEYQKEMLSSNEMFINMGYKFRMVYNIEDLIEKALIFHEGYDDRTIEILKFINTLTIKAQYPDEKVEQVRFIKDEGVCKFLYFGKQIRESAIPQDTYKKAHEDFSQRYSNMDYEVNKDWASNFLSLLSKEAK